MKAEVKITRAPIFEKLTKMYTRASDMRAFLNTTVFDMYRQAQIKRWMTENVSEGSKWKKLTPNYKKWKLKRYASFPGGGRKLLIATGLLSRSAIGQDVSGFRKIVNDRSLIINISETRIPYARDVAKARPFMRFGKKTKEKIKRAMMNYWIKGRVPRGTNA